MLKVVIVALAIVFAAGETSAQDWIVNGMNNVHEPRTHFHQTWLGWRQIPWERDSDSVATWRPDENVYLFEMITPPEGGWRILPEKGYTVHLGWDVAHLLLLTIKPNVTLTLGNSSIDFLEKENGLRIAPAPSANDVAGSLTIDGDLCQKCAWSIGVLVDTSFGNITVTGSYYIVDAPLYVRGGHLTVKKGMTISSSSDYGNTNESYFRQGTITIGTEDAPADLIIEGGNLTLDGARLNVTGKIIINGYDGPMFKMNGKDVKNR